jgi:hypothetical protein
MAKRFTDSDKWKKQWFRRLRPAHKCFWHYVLDNCNNAGIWDVDFEAAAFHVGEELNALEVMETFRKQYLPFALGKRWFLIDFVEFQYGELRNTNHLHVSVINTLKKHGLYEAYLAKQTADADAQHEKQSVLGDHKGHQEEEEVKDKEEEKDQDPDLRSGKEKTIASDVPEESIRATKQTLLKAEFEIFRRAYPGTKRSLDVEWNNFRKKHSAPDILPLLMPAVERGKAYRAGCDSVGAWCAEWPHLSTWINQSRWTQEFGAIPAPRPTFGPRAASRDQLEQTMDEALLGLKGNHDL